MELILSIYKIFPIFLVYVNAESDQMQTSTTICDSECLKPTTLFRRIYVDQSLTDDLNLPLKEVFRARHNKKARKRSEIWEWDSWCQLQPKRGDCSKHRQIFYYNAQLDECLNFTFSGCGGNKNNFNTLVDCERHCKGAVHAELKNLDSATICSLQPNAGLCLSLYNKYYFDVNEGMCKRFLYGGCGGNENIFDTKHKCSKHCTDINNSVSG